MEETSFPRLVTKRYEGKWVFLYLRKVEDLIMQIKI